MRHLVAALLLGGLSAAALADDWFDNWQNEQNAERRHKETLQALGDVSAPAGGGAVYLVPQQSAAPAPSTPAQMCAHVTEKGPWINCMMDAKDVLSEFAKTH